MDGVDRHQTALEYLAMGFSVIPVRPGGKEPLVPWATYQERYPTAEDIDTPWHHHGEDIRDISDRC